MSASVDSDRHWHPEFERRQAVRSQLWRRAGVLLLLMAAVAAPGFPIDPCPVPVTVRSTQNGQGMTVCGDGPRHPSHVTPKLAIEETVTQVRIDFGEATPGGGCVHFWLPAYLDAELGGRTLIDASSGKSLEGCWRV